MVSEDVIDVLVEIPVLQLVRRAEKPAVTAAAAGVSLLELVRVETRDISVERAAHRTHQDVLMELDAAEGRANRRDGHLRRPALREQREQLLVDARVRKERVPLLRGLAFGLDAELIPLLRADVHALRDARDQLPHELADAVHQRLGVVRTDAARRSEEHTSEL